MFYCSPISISALSVEAPPLGGTLSPTIILNMSLKLIWWWDSAPGDLGNVEYSFIVINPRSTLTLLGSHLWIKLAVQSFTKDYY